MMELIKIIVESNEMQTRKIMKESNETKHFFLEKLNTVDRLLAVKGKERSLKLL
jgi:hypothetical protein